MFNERTELKEVETALSDIKDQEAKIASMLKKTLGKGKTIKKRYL